MMNFLKSVEEAETVLSIADSIVNRLARILINRLRKVSNVYTLRMLKKELNQFNSTTGEWKN